MRRRRWRPGVELGEYFTNPSAFSGTHLPYCTCTYDGEVATPAIPGLTCDADGSISAADLLGDLINYGSRAGEWQPSGGDHVPEDWVGDGTLDSNRDGDYLGMPYLTSFCTACKRIRSDEPFLSHVARDPDLRVRMCMKVSLNHRRKRESEREAVRGCRRLRAAARCGLPALSKVGSGGGSVSYPLT